MGKSLGEKVTSSGIQGLKAERTTRELALNLSGNIFKSEGKKSIYVPSMSQLALVGPWMTRGALTPSGYYDAS